MTNARPARRTFVELAHAEALLDALDLRPQLVYGAPVDEVRAYYAPITQAAAWRDAELAAVRDLLCWKCAGHGMTQWRHRAGGVCFTCNGDGWSAKGRRAAKSGGDTG